MVPTFFTQTLETEIQRLAFTSLMAARGFYTQHGFQIVSAHADGRMEKVVLPDLPYQTIPDYWKSVTKLPQAFPLSLPENLHQPLFELLKKAYVPVDSNEIQKNGKG